MGFNREYTVIELDASRLSVLGAVVTKTGVEITRWHSAMRPESVPADKPAQVGNWLASELKDAGFSRSHVVFAMPRNDVVLKPLTLPNGADVSEASIGGAVRLQMVRQLTMSMDGTAIDYTVMPNRADGSVGVIAGAMPGDRLQWCREVASAAGCKLRRIALRCSGAAALLGEVSQRRSGPILGIAVGGESTEFVVVEDGQMMLARAAELARPSNMDEYEPFTQRLAVEAKRTWMSYRSSTPGPEVELIAVLGDGKLAQRVGDACAKGLNVPGHVVPLPSIATRVCEVPEGDRGSMAALAGLLVESFLDKPSLDFANPRKIPDLGARRRQTALAAAAVLIIVGGAGLVAAKKDLARLDADVKAAQSKESSLRKQVNDYLILHARVNHIEQWKQARTEWLPHIHKLSDQLPSPHDSTTDELSGRMLAAAYYDAKGKSSYPGGQWANSIRTTFDLSGKVDNRTLSADLREKILAEGIYSLESRGPDMPDRYAIELVTRLPLPISPKAPDPNAKSSKPASIPKAELPSPQPESPDVIKPELKTDLADPLPISQDQPQEKEASR